MELLLNIGITVCLMLMLAYCLVYFLYLVTFLGQLQGNRYGKIAKAQILQYKGPSVVFPDAEYNPLRKLCRKKRYYLYEIQYVDAYVNDVQKGFYLTKNNTLHENEEVDIKHVLGRHGRLHVIQEQTIPWLRKIVILWTGMNILLIIVANVCVFLFN